jgi:hypothetical protein
MNENNIDVINNMDISLWSKSGWDFLFCVVLIYNPKDKQKYYNFFNNLQYVLPCKICRVNFKEKLKTLNDNALSSKKNLLSWLTKIRNEIAISKGKKTFTEQQINDNIYLTIIYILIIIILIMIYCICKN